MNTIEIPAIGVCREIPSKWSEMTPEQARVTMRLLWDMESGLISPLEFHVRVLYLLLGIKPVSYTHLTLPTKLEV